MEAVTAGIGISIATVPIMGDPDIGARMIAFGNALTSIIVVDGLIVGTWKRTLRRDAAVIETNFFSRLTKAQHRAVFLAAQRYGDFVQRPVRLNK